MYRNRDLSRWPLVHTHASPKSYLSGQVTPGLQSIVLGQSSLDLFIEDRGATTTIVVFHAALTNRVKTVPAFQGRGLAHEAGINLISVSDPTLGLGDIDLAWFLGSRSTGKLPPLLSALVQHSADALGTRRLILFGASGGGYASVLFGQYFPECIVLAVNPRLDLSARPEANIGRYLTVGHGVEGATPRRRVRREFVIEKLAPLYRERLPFDLCIFQNLGDLVFINNQLVPFVQDLHREPRLFTRVEWTGQGHSPIPTRTVRAIVKELSRDGDRRSVIQNAGFKSTSI